MKIDPCIAVLDARQLDRGWLVKPNARRFSNYHHATRQLVHLMGGWCARAPEMSIKILIGTHIWDNAQHLEGIRQRLKELRYPSELPACPSIEYGQFLDELDEAQNSLELLVGIYRVLKPRLISAYQWHLVQCDPLIDEPSIRLLKRMVSDEGENILQGNAAIEMLMKDAKAAEAALKWQSKLERMATDLGDLGEIPLILGKKRAWPQPKLLPINKRDAHVQVFEDIPFTYTPEAGKGTGWRSLDPEEYARSVHGQVDAEMVAAEVMGRNIYEYPTQMPLAFYIAMARQVWDEVRHAHVAIKFLENAGKKYGDYPVTHLGYSHHCQHELVGRLIMFNRISEGGAMVGAGQQSKEILAAQGDAKVAEYFDYIFADEVAHVYNGDHWAKHLCGNDSQKFKETMTRVIAFDSKLNSDRAEAYRRRGDEAAAKRYAANDRTANTISATTGFKELETSEAIDLQIAGYADGDKPDTMPD
jgi:hypothetical protein